MQGSLPTLTAEAAACLHDSLPLCFEWKQSVLTVQELLDYWRESGRWWAGEPPREICIVRASGGIYLLTRPRARENWSAKPLD